MPTAVERIAEPKGAPKGPRKPARSFKDWDEEERSEFTRTRKGLVGPEDIIAGSDYKFLNWDDPKWFDPATGVRYRVSNFYPAAKLIIDYPPSEKYVAAKKAFFASIQQLYLCILPGEPMDQDAAIEELERQALAFEAAPKEAKRHEESSPAAAAPARADKGDAPQRQRPAAVAKKKPKGKPRHA